MVLPLAGQMLLGFRTGVAMLMVMLQQLGIPQEGVAPILTVDRLPDMSCAVVNVTGNATACLVLSAWEQAWQRNA